MRILAAAAAASAMTLLPVVGWAQTSDPISINTCGVMTSANSGGPSVGGIALTSSSNGIRIQFTNETQKTADVVNFAVDSNGRKFVIRDAGTFSPGIEIDHRYRNGAGQSFVLPQFLAPQITCTVASVRFTDGTIWRAGENMSPPVDVGSDVLRSSPSEVIVSRGTDGQIVLVSSKQRIATFTERDNCSGVANVAVVATGESTSAYRVEPLALGSCSATVVDELGNTLKIPIAVR